MIIGFTGTRHGMTANQKRQFASVLKAVSLDDSILVFRHGDCKGADAEAHDIVLATCPRTTIAAHPSDLDGWRAHKAAHVIFDPLPPLQRNHYIVDNCDLLVAAPQTEDEVMQSGTWATIRYARKSRRKLRIILP